MNIENIINNYFLFSLTEQNTENKTKFKNDQPPIDFDKMAATLDRYENTFIDDYTVLHKEFSDALVKQIKNKKILENKDLKTIDSLKIAKGDYKRLLMMYLAKLYFTGKIDGIKQISKRLKKAKAQFKDDLYLFQVDDEDMKWLDRDWVKKYLADYDVLGKLSKDDIEYLKKIKDQSFYLSGELEKDMVKKVFYAVKQGIDTGAPTYQTITNIEQALNEDRQKYATTIARTNEADAYNNGQMNLWRSDEVRPLIQAFEYSAVLDNTTTEFCRQHDGQIILANDPQLPLIKPPNHFNCRSILIPIFIGEDEMPDSYYSDWKNKYDTWGTGVDSKYRLPDKGFGGNQAWSEKE